MKSKKYINAIVLAFMTILLFVVISCNKNGKQEQYQYNSMNEAMTIEWDDDKDQYDVFVASQEKHYWFDMGHTKVRFDSDEEYFEINDGYLVIVKKI